MVNLGSLNYGLQNFCCFQVDGKFTLNENICDVDGLNVVSDAMLSLPHAPNDLVYLPNNPYNPQQLFFIVAGGTLAVRLAGAVDPPERRGVDPAPAVIEPSP